MKGERAKEHPTKDMTKDIKDRTKEKGGGTIIKGDGTGTIGRLGLDHFPEENISEPGISYVSAVCGSIAVLGSFRFFITAFDLEVTQFYNSLLHPNFVH